MMWPFPASRAVIGVVLLSLILLACSPAAAPRPAPRPNSPSSDAASRAAVMDACELLSQEESALLTGKPMQKPVPATVEGGAGCTYRSVDPTESYSLVLLEVVVNAEAAFERNRSANARRIGNLGDDAYLNGGREIDALVNGHWLRIAVQGKIRSVDALEEAARTVADRLSR